MKKIVKIHRLPTEVNVSKTDLRGLLYLDTKGKPKQYPIGNKPIDGYVPKFQHLYFTSDEIINNRGIIEGCNIGDYVMVEGEVKQIHHIGEPFNFKGTLGFSTQENADREYVKYCKKIVATTDWELHKYDILDNGENIPGISQISQSFIEEYVKAGGIDEVYLEYVYNQDVLDEYNKEIDYNGNTCIDLEDGLELKLDQNNCVITHPVKSTFNYDDITHAIAYGHTMAKQGLSHHQTLINYKEANNIQYKSTEPKLYTKEEFKNILFQYAEDEHAWFSCKSEIDSFNNWIKENLK